MGFNTYNGQPYLKLTFTDNRVYFEHAKDGVIDKVYWSESTLTDAFKSKYPHERLYYVKADTRMVNGKEAFHYVEAYYLEHFSAEKMMNNVRSGIIFSQVQKSV